MYSANAVFVRELQKTRGPYQHMKWRRGIADIHIEFFSSKMYMDSLHIIQAICEYHKHQLRAVPLCSLQIASSFHETFLIKYNGMGDTRYPTINNWSSVIRQNEHGYFPTGFGI